METPVPEQEPMESPIGSGDTVVEHEEDHVETMKPAKVRLIDYPKGFKTGLRNGSTFQVNGEVFQVYDVKDMKKGHPRFLIRGIGIIGIVDEHSEEEKIDA